MQTSSVLSCPNCGADLTEALARQLREEISADLTKRFRESEEALKARSKEEQAKAASEWEQQRRTLDEARVKAETALRQRDEEFREALAKQQAELQKAAEFKARESVSAELQSLRENVEEQKRLSKDQNAREIELLRKTRELEERQERAALEAERMMAEERQKVRTQVEGQFNEQFRLREVEKDKKIEDMQKLIDDLQRKSQQGSQQTQGEVLEIVLEELLRSNFLFDDIKPVPKGVRGADVTHRVIESSHDCGMILWEFKRTKAWSKEWVSKLKEDMRETHANVSVIVSAVLPEGIDSFGNLQGVWVCSPDYAIPLATVLRESIVEIARQRRAAEGKSDKMDMLYNYLTGNDFANHMKSMIEVFVTMRKELDDERRAFEKIWSKRLKQIERTERSALRIRGDLEGIVGNALQPMQNLELPSADGDDSDS